MRVSAAAVDVPDYYNSEDEEVGADQEPDGVLCEQLQSTHVPNAGGARRSLRRSAQRQRCLNSSDEEFDDGEEELDLSKLTPDALRRAKRWVVKIEVGRAPGLHSYAVAALRRGGKEGIFKMHAHTAPAGGSPTGNVPAG
jgi:hypothetical protein